MTKEILTRNGDIILCDDADYDRLNQYSWSIVNGYAVTSVPMHRMVSQPERSQVVDHINNQRTDNRRANLRNVSHAQNMQNRLGIRRKVYDDVTGKFWLLRGFHLVGIYDTKKQQHEAWCETVHGSPPSITNTTIPID